MRAMTYGKQARYAPTTARPGAELDTVPTPGRTTRVQHLAMRIGTPAVQKKEVARSTTDDPHATAAEGVVGGGSSLPFLSTIQRAFGVHDVTGVEAHTDDAAAEASGELGAKAYAVGNHVAFAGAPDLHTAAHEAAHVVQQRAGVSLEGGISEVGDPYERHADAVADRVVAGESAEDLLGELAPAAASASIQRKEINPDGDYDRMTNAAANMTSNDWLRADRLGLAGGSRQRWHTANKNNLLAGDSSQYKQIDERRDFYKWFYELACAQGYETRWMLAAYLVANGASQVANMDTNALQAFGNSITGVAPVGLQAAMRQGNQMIFDNVFPKLRQLWLGGPLRGKAALDWDMRTLAEEQALVQPMYNALGPNLTALNNIAHQWGLWVGIGVAINNRGIVPAGPYNKENFLPGLPDTADITQPINRWRYGMTLGNLFAPTPTGYTDATPMPAVGASYQMNGTSNAEFDAVNTRPGLHALEAYINPAYIGDRRNGTGSADQYFASIVSGLTNVEKQQILTDRMPDGNRYSTAMGRLGGVIIGPTILYSITDDEALACLPRGANPTAVDAFMTNLRVVRSENLVNAAPPRIGW